MKISILLPYKENFSPEYPGAVSIYVKDTTLCSKYKKNIKIYGSTNYKKKLLNNYINLPFKKELLKSKKYYRSLRLSDIAIFDSGFFCILLRIFKKLKVKKLSGYLFLKLLLENKEIKNKKFFLINPTLAESKKNYQSWDNDATYGWKKLSSKKFLCINKIRL